MSGFSADWLALREPADHASINSEVRERLRRHFEDCRSMQIVDLGSGTGSNLRSLWQDLPHNQHWHLVDHDTNLLELARLRITERAPAAPSLRFETVVADLSQGGIDHLITKADLVTAAALFDLISERIIGTMIDQIAAAGSAFYATLTYDGEAAWQPEHPADRSMQAAFNRHQETDKGFGPAAGPGASKFLATRFEHHGYSVARGKSPWILNDSYDQLRRETNQGWAAAVAETGLIAQDEIAKWLSSHETAEDAVTIIGHEDVLALPPIPA